MTRRNAFALGAAVVVLAGCGSKLTAAQTATNNVCNASALIKTDVGKITSNVVAPGTPAAINAKTVPPPTGSIQHIAAELAVITKNVSALPPSVRPQVVLGTGSFVRVFRPLSVGLRAAPAGEAPPAQLKLFTTAQKLLPTAYTKTLGTIKC